MVKAHWVESFLKGESAVYQELKHVETLPQTRELEEACDESLFDFETNFKC